MEGGVFGDGYWPAAGLIEDASGDLYGTTSQGGRSLHGVVFKLDTQENLTVLYTFQGSPDDGAIPNGRLVADSDGNFYGTTSTGGPYCPVDGCGTVYKLDPSGKETVLYSFQGRFDGNRPQTR